NAALKNELVYRTAYPTREQARRDVARRTVHRWTSRAPTWSHRVLPVSRSRCAAANQSAASD
ncbi:MAG TPA: hypothetical protein VI365_31805, partial [Trebonia sp.]